MCIHILYLYVYTGTYTYMYAYKSPNRKLRHLKILRDCHLFHILALPPGSLDLPGWAEL